MDTTANELTKDRQNAMLGGVCAGLARYLDLDVSLIRALFIGSVAFSGFGLAAYLALWILLDVDPEVLPPCDVAGGEETPADESQNPVGFEPLSRYQGEPTH